MYPTGKNQVESDLGFEVARVLVHPFQSRHQEISHLNLIKVNFKIINLQMYEDKSNTLNFSEHFKTPNV
jgi:hypothetical protein